MGGDGSGLPVAPVLQGTGNGGIAQGQDLGGEEGGVHRSRLADGKRADGYSGRHLHDGQEAIVTFERRGFDGDAENGQERHGSGHAGEMGGAAGSGYDDPEAFTFSGSGEFIETVGRAVGRYNARLMRDAQRLQGVGRVLHGLPVGLASHDDGDLGLLLSGHAVIGGGGGEESSDDRRYEPVHQLLNLVLEKELLLLQPGELQLIAG